MRQGRAQPGDGPAAQWRTRASTATRADRARQRTAPTRTQRSGSTSTRRCADSLAGNGRSSPCAGSATCRSNRPPTPSGSPSATSSRRPPAASTTLRTHLDPSRTPRSTAMFEHLDDPQPPRPAPAAVRRRPYRRPRADRAPHGVASWLPAPRRSPQPPASPPSPPSGCPGRGVRRCQGRRRTPDPGRCVGSGTQPAGELLRPPLSRHRPRPPRQAPQPRRAEHRRRRPDHDSCHRPPADTAACKDGAPG